MVLDDDGNPKMVEYNQGQMITDITEDKGGDAEELIGNYLQDIANIPTGSYDVDYNYTDDIKTITVTRANGKTKTFTIKVDQDSVTGNPNTKKELMAATKYYHHGEEEAAEEETEEDDLNPDN